MSLRHLARNLHQPLLLLFPYLPGRIHGSVLLNPTYTGYIKQYSSEILCIKLTKQPMISPLAVAEGINKIISKLVQY